MIIHDHETYAYMYSAMYIHGMCMQDLANKAVEPETQVDTQANDDAENAVLWFAAMIPLNAYF